jgi:hypothetical protein
MKKNLLKRLHLKELKELPQTQMDIKKCLRTINITQNQSKDGLETCIKHFLKLILTNMIIYTSKRATSSHITKEITLGMRMNLTIVMRKTGIKKPKVQH